MRYLLVVGAMLTIGVGIWAQSPIRRDGDWEVKVEMQIPGMPMNLPVQTIRRCITLKRPQILSLPPTTRVEGRTTAR